MFYENSLDTYAYEMRPDGSSPFPRQVGWHRKFSSYSLSFMDGSAKHQYVDTRYSVDPEGATWTTWPEPKTVTPDIFYP